MKTDMYLLKVKIIGVFFFLLTVSFVELVAQPLCNDESCITVSLAEFDMGVQVISGYEDIGDTTLFCGYEEIGILGIFVELQAGGGNPMWSFNSMLPSDPFFTITSDGVVTIEVTTDVSSCSCQVILAPPTSPQANDITIPLCGDSNTVNFNTSDIDESTIATGNISISYYLTMGAANTGNQTFIINGDIDVSSGDKIFARVEDANTPNCFSIAEVAFTINPSPTANPTSSTQTLNCNTPQATINANTSEGTPPYVYAWTTNDGNILGSSIQNSISVDSAGTYIISVTDNNGCSTTGEAMINENFTEPEFGAMSISAPNGTEINCDISTISLIANASSPDGSTPSYEWTTANGNISGDINQAMTTVSAAGTYTLTATHPSTGCTISDNIVITEIDAPPTPQIFPNNPTLTCLQTEIILIGNSSGVMPLTFMWSTSANTPSITITTPNTYTLTVTDANGCDAIASTTVDQSLTAPTPVITTPQIITCNNTNVQLDASGSTTLGAPQYLWSTGAVTSMIGVEMPGDYTVTVTNAANGCTAETAVTVTENTTAPISNNDALQGCPESGTNEASFDLTQANITSEPNISTTYYENSNLTSPINTPTNYPSSGGTVYANVEFDDNGCSSTAEIELSVLPINVPDNLYNIYFGGVCSAQTITVAAPNDQYNYSWRTDATGEIRLGDECTALNITSDPSNFFLDISDDSGCLETVEFNINLNAAPTNTKVFLFGSTNTLFCNRSDFDSYQWGKEKKDILCAEPMAGETFQDVVVADLDTDTYYYWVIVNEGTCTHKVYLNGDDNSPFGKLVADPNIEYGDLALQINPNPNNGAFELSITGDEVRDLDVHIYDALGRMIYQQDVPKIYSVHTHYIAVPKLTQGVYFVRVTGNNGILLTEKIIVK